MCRVVNIRNEKCEVYIGRGSKWGNPFRMRNQSNDERKRVIDEFHRYLLATPKLMADLHELRGKTIGCYCAPLPCHGDILKYYAMRQDKGE